MNENKLIRDIKAGILKGEFQVYYQPIVNSISEKVTSAEALIRWYKGQKEILPRDFIPVLEKRKLISLLDQYIVENVISFLKKRKMAGMHIVPVSINLSWLDISNAIMMSRLLKELDTCNKLDIPISIEITETTYSAILENKSDALTAVKKLGTKLLLDDYGVGYSSLETLQNFNFDILKIDGSFIRQLETNNKTQKILHSTIKMAHELGMELIAEGVENKHQMEFLRDSGCDYIQGYYYYRPLSEGVFSDFLDEMTKNS